ncbi:MAG: hypothetical protein GX451_07865 [Acholeplasmataceae bacterium]|nr:hypothetical protein [Acholeplasmataceae bacterium]
MFGACGYGGTAGFYGGPISWLGMSFGIITHLAFTALLLLAVVWMFKTVFRKNDESSTKQ